jgi:tetratricopeptide (TPR) repeat protein
MALRTATVETTLRPERRSAAEWRALVDQAIIEAAAAVRSGTLDELGAVFERVGGWDDEHRAFQAECKICELVLTTTELADGLAWTQLYVTTAEHLLAALRRAPLEPVHLNTLGVLLYELVELQGAKACFEAAGRLDPALEHVARNLDELRRRERARMRSPLPKGLQARARVLGDRAAKLAAAARPAADLRLSLCMIVKDEEEMLPGCLDAVRDAVDEIVVVDTGSSDRTVAIAESFGAKVISFPWNGSFSDARNVSLDAATGDWIIYLDADEHLFAEDAPLLRQLTGRTWREGFYLVETNYTGGDESGHAVTHTALRVFRNRPEYRFEGRIHEQKTHTMPTFLPERFETTTIRLRHYGYLKNRLLERDKSRRNIELLERERRESKNPFNAFNLGSEYMALGEWDRSRRSFDEAWDGVRGLDAWQAIPYVPLLVSRVARVRREAGDVAAARQAIRDGLATYPDHTDLVFEQALCARQDGDLAEAAALAERCLELGDAPAGYAATVGSGSHLALALLGDVRAAQGLDSEAEALYAQALDQHPDFVAPVLSLASSMLRRGASDAEVLESVPAARTAARMLLATAFHEAGRHDAAEASFRTVLARQPANGAARIGLVESLLSQRRYPEAAAEARREPEDSPFHPHALLELAFAAAVTGDAAELERTLAAAQTALVGADELELYRAWLALLRGNDAPRALAPTAAGPLCVVLEALLRVQEFDAFALVLPLLERTVGDRERRELLAQMYLRRGYLDSAGDEWAAVCERQPDALAFLGLAQVAVAKGAGDDALMFAQCAVELDPESAPAQPLLRRLRERAAAPDGLPRTSEAAPAA